MVVVVVVVVVVVGRQADKAWQAALTFDLTLVEL